MNRRAEVKREIETQVREQVARRLEGPEDAGERFLLKKGYKVMGNKFVKRHRGTIITLTKKASNHWKYELKKGSKHHSGEVSSPVMADQYAMNDVRMEFWTGRRRDNAEESRITEGTTENFSKVALQKAKNLRTDFAPLHIKMSQAYARASQAEDFAVREKNAKAARHLKHSIASYHKANKAYRELMEALSDVLIDLQNVIS